MEQAIAISNFFVSNSLTLTRPRGAFAPKIVELVYTARNFLKNHKVHFRGPVGSLAGPRLVFDHMGVRCIVPRVPLNVFCCLVCESIAKTADFMKEDDKLL